MRREFPPGTLESVVQAIANWEEAVEWIAKGWDCIEEYTHDLFAREMLDDAIAAYSELLPADLIARIQAVDQRLRDVTIETKDSVWSSGFAVGPNEYNQLQHWYYFRWPHDGIGKF